MVTWTALGWMALGIVGVIALGAVLLAILSFVAAMFTDKVD